MNRRKFLHGLMTGTAGAAAGVGLANAAGSLVDANPKENRLAAFRVTGFSCVTCATGLEVTLLKHKGVVSAKATYPEGEVVVGFDDTQIAEKALKEIILECGFGAETQGSKII